MTTDLVNSLTITVAFLGCSVGFMAMSMYYLNKAVRLQQKQIDKLVSLLFTKMEIDLVLKDQQSK